MTHRVMHDAHDARLGWTGSAGRPRDVTASDGTRRFGRWALLLGSLAWMAAAFLPSISLWQAVDYWLLHQPNKVYFARALAEGRLPLWNPHVGLGRPFLADVETAVFYPPSLLFALVDADAALFLVTWLHTVIAALGMLRLARFFGAERGGDAVAALGWATASLTAGRLFAGQLGYAQALAWMPWVLWLGARLPERRNGRALAGLAVVSALQFLCGHPQAWWLTLVGAATLVVGREARPPWRSAGRRALVALAWLALGTLLALGLAGIQVGPTLELVGQSNRAESDAAFAAFGSLRPRELLSLLMPEGLSGAGHWEASLYGGVAIAVGGAIGLLRRRDPDGRALALLALVGALLALAGRTPLFSLLYEAVPGVSLFRLPRRAAVLIALVLPVACGRWLARRDGRGAWIAVLLGAVAAALPVAGFGPAAGATAVTQGAIALASGAALLAWHRLGPRPVWLGALLAVAALDAVHAAERARQSYAFTNQRRHVLEPREREIVERLRAFGAFTAEGAPPRIGLPHTLMRENGGLVHGHSTFLGYGSLTLDRVWQTLHGSLRLAVPRFANTYPAEEILDRGPFPYSTMNLVMGWEPKTSRVIVRSDPDPRAFLTTRAITVAGLEDAVRRLAAGHDIRMAALVEAAAWPPELFVDGAGAVPGTAGAHIVRFAPEEIRVQVEANAPALLVLSEAWYPGWSARVDGVEAPCRPVNAWMRGVPVPAGAREVVLRYRSRPLAFGALVSLVSAAVLVVLVRRDDKALPGAAAAVAG